jgi:hypothetical protein
MEDGTIEEDFEAALAKVVSAFSSSCSSSSLPSPFPP